MTTNTNSMSLKNLFRDSSTKEFRKHNFRTFHVTFICNIFVAMIPSENFVWNLKRGI